MSTFCNVQSRMLAARFSEICSSDTPDSACCQWPMSTWDTAYISHPGGATWQRCCAPEFHFPSQKKPFPRSNIPQTEGQVRVYLHRRKHFLTIKLPRDPAITIRDANSHSKHDCIVCLSAIPNRCALDTVTAFQPTRAHPTRCIHLRLN